MALRETENNAYAKFWSNQQRLLWYVTAFSVLVNCINWFRWHLARSRFDCPSWDSLKKEILGDPRKGQRGREHPTPNFMFKVPITLGRVQWICCIQLPSPRLKIQLAFHVVFQPWGLINLIKSGQRYFITKHKGRLVITRTEYYAFTCLLVLKKKPMPNRMKGWKLLGRSFQQSLR